MKLKGCRVLRPCLSAPAVQRRAMEAKGQLDSEDSFHAATALFSILCRRTAIAAIAVIVTRLPTRPPLSQDAGRAQRGRRRSLEYLLGVSPWSLNPNTFLNQGQREPPESRTL